MIRAHSIWIRILFSVFLFILLISILSSIFRLLSYSFRMLEIHTHTYTHSACERNWESGMRVFFLSSLYYFDCFNNKLLNMIHVSQFSCMWLKSTNNWFKVDFFFYSVSKCSNHRRYNVIWNVYHFIPSVGRFCPCFAPFQNEIIIISNKIAELWDVSGWIIMERHMFDIKLRKLIDISFSWSYIWNGGYTNQTTETRLQCCWKRNCRKPQYLLHVGIHGKR